MAPFFADDNNQLTFEIEVRGRFRSFDIFTVGIISPTITHPDYRRRGYATLCLRDCARLMGEEGVAVSALWTQEVTFPFYQQSGWEAVGSQGWVYYLEPEDDALFAAGGSFPPFRGDPGHDGMDGP